MELIQEVFSKDALILLQSQSLFLKVRKSMATLQVILEVATLKTSEFTEKELNMYIFSIGVGDMNLGVRGLAESKGVTCSGIFI